MAPVSQISIDDGRAHTCCCPVRHLGYDDGDERLAGGHGCHVQLLQRPWAALIVGFTGSIVYYAQSWITEHIFHMDDPLDAAALHMGAGFWYVAERKRSTGPDAEGRCVVLDRSLTNVLLNTAGE
jgi:hypothetical protein